MRLTSFIFSALLSLIHGITIGQAAINTGKEKYTIPFTITPYNNMLIEAILNKQDTVMLMLHTATGDVIVTEEAALRLKTIHFDGRVDSVKSWGGGNNSAGFSSNNSLAIENGQWDSVTIWNDKNSGQQSDGKFGLNLFKNKVLEVDFNKKVLVVQTKLPAGIKTYSKFKLRFKDDQLFIHAICGTDSNNYENDFLIHTGYGGGVLLDDKFVSESQIAQHIHITGEKKLTDAYGHAINTKKGTLSFFKIGNLKMKNVPVGFFEGAIGRQKISVMGGDILKRFNWVIDGAREYIYLKPNSLFNTPYSKI